MEPGDLDDDLPPLVGEDGEEVPPEAPALAPAPAKEAKAAASIRKREEVPAPESATGGYPSSSSSARERDPEIDWEKKTELPEGMSEADALRATAALHAATRVVESEMEKPQLSDKDAIKVAMVQSAEPKQYVEPSDVTKRMVQAIAKDDFEEVEDAIYQGADVHADCGGGMQAIHLTALRGEMFLTELLLAHGANVNARDMSGNTPLLWTCHFFKNHKRGVQMVSQLLHHKADPFYTTKDGKLAGNSAMDLMDKECRLAKLDENAPKQMRAMLQLSMDSKPEGQEVIDKMWASFKSQNKKLYQVSSKKDNYDYAMKSINWDTPDNAKNAQSLTPVKLDAAADSILEEKFTFLTDYSFSDESEKVKVYVTFPERCSAALAEKENLSVEFQFQSFDLKLKAGSEGSFRCRLDPLFGSIEAEECKHRVSAASKRVTLTLVKRHKTRRWTNVLKPN
jgi:hypothetical protein